MSRDGYGESCPVAHALDMVGDRWALLVVRELRLGPRRFVDLQTALPRTGPTTLTQRLRDLVDNGVVERDGDGRRAEYRLTAWGAELEPVFGALARWGVRSPVVPLEGPISEDAVMLGVRTFVAGAEPVRAAPVANALIEVALARESYRLTIADGRLETLRRKGSDDHDDHPDSMIKTDSSTIQALLTGRASVSAVWSQVACTGDRRLARWLLGLLTPRGRI
jgi:DNA-binding HxlR family transcriptional regulator